MLCAGLSNSELEHATGLITIPTNPGFGSLNLAQAVLLMCYEWGTSDAGQAALADSSEQTSSGDSSSSCSATQDAEDDLERATQGQLESLFEFWEESLWRSDYFKKGDEARAAAGMGKLRRLILRGDPDKGEASLLRGALKSLVQKMDKANDK